MNSHTPLSRWRMARTARIERRATAIRTLADATVDLAAARELDADTSPDTGHRSTRNVVTAALVGVIVIALALLGTLVAVGLGTEFWATRLPASATHVKILGLPFAIDLTKAVPVGAEGVVWGLTLMAIILVTYRRRYGAYTRPMWAIASTVALINGMHNSTYDLVGGLGLGALSISSPYLVHKYVLFVRAMKDGKTIADAAAEVASRWRAIGRLLAGIAVAVFDFVLHPVITAAAVLLWRMHRHVSYGHAHQTVVAHIRDRRAAPKGTYHRHLIDLIDPAEVDAGRPAKTAAKRRPTSASPSAVPATAQAPDAAIPPTVDETVEQPATARHAKEADVVSIERPAGRPDWVTNNTTPTEAMKGWLDRHGDGETSGALLDRWVADLGLSHEFTPGLGRKVLFRWRKQLGDGPVAVGGE